METREEVLKRINWDYTYSVEEQERLLASDNLSDKKHIYLKLLQSVRWYTLLSILTEKELKEALSVDVIRAVFPRPLRDTYMYASKTLFG
jgi:hypothetical protein